LITSTVNSNQSACSCEKNLYQGKGSHVVLKVLKKYLIVKSVFKTLKKSYIEFAQNVHKVRKSICSFKFFFAANNSCADVSALSFVLRE